MEAGSVDEIGERLVLRLRVEEFLVEEAHILDEWRLDEWLELFTEDGVYVVPATDLPQGDPATDLTLIDDDQLRLKWRVNRLKSRHAHREYPWSRTRRLVTNVRVVEDRGDEIDVEANVLVYRFRHKQSDYFVGRYRHTLVRAQNGFRFRRRRTEIDQETLSPNGAISMIL